MPVQSALIEAIQSRCIVEFNDGGGYERIGEPHLLGICSETGTTQLEMMQTDGQKAKAGEQLPQWRRFTISEIWNLRVTAVEFVPRDEFDPRSLRWSRVIVCVNHPAPTPAADSESE